MRSPTRASMALLLALGCPPRTPPLRPGGKDFAGRVTDETSVEQDALAEARHRDSTVEPLAYAVRQRPRGRGLPVDDVDALRRVWHLADPGEQLVGVRVHREVVEGDDLGSDRHVAPGHLQLARPLLQVAASGADGVVAGEQPGVARL